MFSVYSRNGWGLVLALGVGALPVAKDASAAESPLQASMQCERASEPGRVRCTVEVRAPFGRSITWADVVILSLPDFASSLRGRIGPADTLSQDASMIRWALGLVARRKGQGDVRARVRLVVCDAAPEGALSAERQIRCAPVVVPLSASLSVG